METAAYINQIDLEYINNARKQLELAQSLWGFVQANVQQRYKLAQGDAIQEDGRIVRAGADNGAEEEENWGS